MAVWKDRDVSVLAGGVVGELNCDFVRHFSKLLGWLLGCLLMLKGRRYFSEVNFAEMRD
jgi:hypothetical protein